MKDRRVRRAERHLAPSMPVIFVVFHFLITISVILVVSQGQLPDRLAPQWHLPQTIAVNVTGWVGLATGGLLWPPGAQLGFGRLRCQSITLHFTNHAAAKFNMVCLR